MRQAGLAAAEPHIESSVNPAHAELVEPLKKSLAGTYKSQTLALIVELSNPDEVQVRKSVP